MSNSGRTKTASAILTATLLSAAAAGTAAEHYRAPLSDTAPVVDGKLADGEWDRAVGIVIPSQRSAYALVTATETDFYVLISSALPPDDVPLLTVQQRDDSTRVVYDDAVEVFVDPDPGAEKGTEYQFLANSIGAHCYLANSRGEVKPQAQWDGQYEMGNGFADGRWIAEIRVPIANIVSGWKATDGVWGLSACRDWKRPWVFSSTAPGFRSGGRGGRSCVPADWLCANKTWGTCTTGGSTSGWSC